MFTTLVTDGQTDGRTGENSMPPSFLTVGGISRSSAVAERPRDASCHWTFW